MAQMDENQKAQLRAEAIQEVAHAQLYPYEAEIRHMAEEGYDGSETHARLLRKCLYTLLGDMTILRAKICGE